VTPRFSNRDLFVSFMCLVILRSQSKFLLIYRTSRNIAFFSGYGNRVTQLSSFPQRPAVSFPLLFTTSTFALRRMTTATQPPWKAPERPEYIEAPKLEIYNSLTRKKNAFVPIDWENNTVTWYACGPTVYDDSHLGHARNYVTTDIIRRILRDFFGFKLKFVMNITDIDDKIIIRGRQRYLLDEFTQGKLETYKDLTTVRRAALSAYIQKHVPDVPSDSSLGDIDSTVTVAREKITVGSVHSDKEAKFLMYTKTILSASRAISALEAQPDVSQDDLDSLDDVIMPYLDDLFGGSVNRHDVWTRLTALYEARFMEDMRALNVLDPDEITRVTEYGPQIVSFVERIQHNKFAYATEGNVYFDIGAFEAANNYYARLEPWNRNDTSLQADGEGALTEAKAGKRSAADFALWKSSKPGEPSWPSPWGPGRPGWHIECSAMAFDKLGSQIDIHSGGIDLAFPHHDNELAQSEAYWADHCDGHQHQWVNYFLHMGHLSIAGSKMSKSLKNFTTIRAALESAEWTPRSLRIVFLLGAWRDGIEITPSSIREASAIEDKINNFFLKANELLASAPEQELVKDNYLTTALDKAEADTYKYLCDSFSTKPVMDTISSLITAYNDQASKSRVNSAATRSIALWVTRMVNIFGLNGTAGPNDTVIGWSGLSVPESAVPILTALSRKRDELRVKAKTGLAKQDLEPVAYPRRVLSVTQMDQEAPFRKILADFNQEISDLNDSTNLAKDVLSLTDRLRDVNLFSLDVYLEDREGQPALIRPVTKELRAAKQEKEDRARQKQKAKEEREKEATSKANKGRLSHRDMFRTEEYSAWDPEGIPTHEKGGEEVTKSKKKKLQKDWERQKKLHEGWMKANAPSADLEAAQVQGA